MIWQTKDSGDRIEFGTGAVRDTQEGKSRPDLISPYFLMRLGDLLARGAVKYGERNWEKGQSTSRALASCMRHLVQYMMGDVSEDHIAAVAFNAMVIIDHQERVKLNLVSHQVVDDAGSIAVLGREGYERLEDGTYNYIWDEEDILEDNELDEDEFFNLEEALQDTVEWLEKNPGHYTASRFWLNTPVECDFEQFDQILDLGVKRGLIWNEGHLYGTEVPF